MTDEPRWECGSCRMTFLRQEPARSAEAERLRCHCGIAYGVIASGKGRKATCWLIQRYYTAERTPSVRDQIRNERQTHTA